MGARLDKEKHELIRTTVKNNPNARGLAVIINNTYDNDTAHEAKYGSLPFTNKDGQAMDDALDSLGFATVRLVDVNKDEIFGTVGTLASYSDYPEGYNCFAIVFSGHGNVDSKIVANDGTEFSFEGIIERLNKAVHDDISDRVLEAPTIVFIDACRGTIAPKVVAKGADSTDAVHEDMVPVNMLIAYATRDGFQSYGNSYEGSEWMQCLAKELKTSEDSVGDVVAKVNGLLTSHPDAKQKPILWNTNVTIKLSKHVAAGGDPKNEPKEQTEHAVAAGGDPKSDPKDAVAAGGDPKKEQTEHAVDGGGDPKNHENAGENSGDKKVDWKSCTLL